ncbi:antiviral reverse transcriptase Drt3b [Paracoccaceae bacterium Fryx2]|nr:antiviral reverse transcriptase Drt3b [Paracoccaceae bacterium Fryx2]
MLKRKRVVLDKNDWVRVLLSETTPAEMPVIVSNDGFYFNIISKNRHAPLDTLINILLTPSVKKRFSIPFNYKITKDRESFRRLSLPHPRAQLEVVNFYKRFSSLIAHYSQVGPFSLRRPKRIASHYYRAGMNDDVFAVKTQDIMDESAERSAKHAASVFSYSGYRRLYRFFDSPTYSNLERKFRHMASLDVNKCFDSIYTHSISWSLKSKTEAKLTTTAESFGGAFDRLMQSMNYNETNGIIIGPEVSRIFAEIIFNKIDLDIHTSLADQGFKNGTDYSIFRYVDNIYVFYNNRTTFNSGHLDF